MILITGSTGFIGSFFTSISGIRFVVRKNAKHSYENFFEIENLCSTTVWNNAFVDVDTIIHLAGIAHSKIFTNNDYYAANVEGTLKLAVGAAYEGVKRFVFVSSIGVNGTSTLDKPFSKISKANPNNAYAKSKYDAEVGLKKIAQETGMELVIIRPTLVYGPNAPGNFGLLTRLIAKVPFLPFGMTNNKRHFIAVQNLVDLLITCAKHPNASGHTFLASDGDSVSTKEFTNAIAKGMNKSVLQLPIPISFMRLMAKCIGKSSMIEQLVGNLEVDSSNLQDVLGWLPPYTMEQSMDSLSKSKKND
jgi:nucleoside-diphosphate-sugar epimerase